MQWPKFVITISRMAEGNTSVSLGDAMFPMVTLPGLQHRSPPTRFLFLLQVTVTAPLQRYAASRCEGCLGLLASRSTALYERKHENRSDMGAI